MDIIEIGKKQLIFLLESTEVCEYDLDKSQNSTVMRSGFRRLITDYGFDGDFLSCLIAGVFCENQLIQIHCLYLHAHEAVPGLPSASRE